METINELPTEGAEPGSLYYVIEDDGIYVWDDVLEWTRLSVAQGPRGATGATGA